MDRQTETDWLRHHRDKHPVLPQCLEWCLAHGSHPFATDESTSELIKNSPRDECQVLKREPNIHKCSRSLSTTSCTLAHFTRGNQHWELLGAGRKEPRLWTLCSNQDPTNPPPYKHLGTDVFILGTNLGSKYYHIYSSFPEEEKNHSLHLRKTKIEDSGNTEAGIVIRVYAPFGSLRQGDHQKLKASLGLSKQTRGANPLFS